ncbi:5192_t:CDS:1 [Entrophospora sp. SA101]|nr:5192_t:CDS:1 [Entrophospora sp. SA101]
MKQDMNIIQGGKLHIRQFLGKGFHKFKKQLQKHSIMFIDQLSSIDGIFLNEWKTITEKSFTTHNRVTRVPQWFKIIENQILQTPDISRRIQPSYIYPATHFKGSTITIPNINTQSKEWVIIWNCIINQPIIGRIVKKYPINNTIVIEHWLHYDLNMQTSPSKSTPSIYSCPGCNINHTQFNIITDDKYNTQFYHCANLYSLQDAILIQKIKKLEPNKYLLGTPIFELKQRAEYHYKFNTQQMTYITVELPNTILQFIESSPLHNLLL